MSDQSWPATNLGELFAINTDGVAPNASPGTEFHHHSLPAWDEFGGPAVEKGSSIESNKTKVTKPCVLVSKLNPRKPRVSVVERVPEEEHHCASTEFVCLEPKSEEPLNFWGHLFSNKSFSDKLDRIAIGSTNSHKRYSPKALLSQRIELPPVTERRLIAHILDTLDTQIQKTQALIAKLEKVKEGLLHDLLTRGIDENGRLRPSPEHAPELYKESPLGLVPHEWSISHVGAIAQVKGGKRLPYGHDYSSSETRFKYLRVTDFYLKSYTSMQLESLEENTFNLLSRYEIHPGDTFVSIAGSIGYFGVYLPNDARDYRVILTENAARIVLEEHVTPKYFALAMNSSASQKQVDAEKGTGGGVPKLALFRIEQILFAIPCRNEQMEIERRSSSLEKHISNERLKLEKMKIQKQGLMDDLLSGRVRVTPLLEKAQATTPA